MFTCDSEGKYTYKGLEDDPSLPADASKIIKTSTVDSKVHADGLPLHESSVHEVEAPKGYVLSSTSIDIIVPDFMSSSSTVDGFKIYLCQRDQKDSKLPIPSPEPTDPPSKSDDIDGTDVNEDALVTNTSSANVNKDITADKLPKTGGLMGSLLAMMLGIFMIGSGIYLIKPSKKQRNNRD